ncbi:MAG: hypothetical protein AB7J30_00350 [Hyphomicrobium sp.]|uniref:hypothetical protein n=1 Tax=Hyphomicrobium sp. TaxID=82 RepID=UPI003D0FC196
MTANYPPFAVFPDLNCVLRLPTGAEYRGKLRQHPSTEADDEHWYEGYLRAEQKDHVTADTVLKDRFNRDGLRPVHFHADSNVEPLRVKLNRVPVAKRTEKNAATLVGEIWNHDGLWTIVSSPSASESLHLAGNVVPSRHEMGFEGSRIRQYQPASATAAPEPEIAAHIAARKGKPARVARPG